jgi:nucleotide-binding universal stress UspA family protein
MNATPTTDFTVLVPVDGSDLAGAVVDLAAAIAHRRGGRVVLLTVPQVYGLDVAWYTAGAPDAAALVPMDDLLAEARADGARYLATAAARLEADGAHVTTLMVEDEPAAAIVQSAREQRAGLIAMSTHGRGGLDRWAFGSIADKVLQTATTPVLLVRPQAGPVKADIGHILVALDGSPLAEAIVDEVQPLARAFGARVTLVNVTPESPVPGSSARISAAEEVYETHITAYLAPIVQRLIAAGVEAEAQILTGKDPAAALLELGADHDVDLIALTSHGRSGLRRLAYGSVADRLIRHAEKPILILRSQQPD